MNRLGMLVDVSHLSKPSMLQAAQLSRTPVVATHSCIHALCAVPRNLDDEQLDCVARHAAGWCRSPQSPRSCAPAAGRTW